MTIVIGKQSNMCRLCCCMNANGSVLDISQILIPTQHVISLV